MLSPCWGMDTVQNAVVTVSVIDALKMKTNLKGFDISTFWSHAIGVAVMCRHLAIRTKFAPAEEAFTAGLLHDIGKVVLVNNFPEIFVRMTGNDAGQPRRLSSKRKKESTAVLTH